MKKDFTELMKKAVIVAIVGGVISYLITLFIGTALATSMGQIVGSIILLVLLLGLAKKAKIDDLNWFHAFVLIFAVGIVGSIFTTFIPFMSVYILSVSEFTLTGLMWTVFYIMVAEIVAAKYIK